MCCWDAQTHRRQHCTPHWQTPTFCNHLGREARATWTLEPSDRRGNPKAAVKPNTLGGKPLTDRGTRARGKRSVTQKQTLRCDGTRRASDGAPSCAFSEHLTTQGHVPFTLLRAKQGNTRTTVRPALSEDTNRYRGLSELGPMNDVSIINTFYTGDEEKSLISKYQRQCYEAEGLTL